MLKIVFFVLLLLNSAVLLWELRTKSVSSSATTNSTPVGSIVLVSELPPPLASTTSTSTPPPLPQIVREQPVKEEPVKAPQNKVESEIRSKTPVKPPENTAKAVEPEKQCYEIGPFNNAAELKRWTETNGVKGDSGYYRQASSLIGYQVYYPTSRDNATAAKQTLKNNGITDMWLITEGERSIGLSLGVFVDKNRAQLFKNQLQQRGLNAEIQERRKNQQQLFSKIQIEKSKAQQLQKAGQSLSHCASH